VEADCQFRFSFYSGAVRPWLPVLLFFDDTAPHGAALNMAIDEALLASAPEPILRVYRWARPAVSFGYFERWGPIRAAHPGREAVRRWTGGGVVLHGEDFTYSLLLPGGRAGAPLGESYGLIHGALRAALADAGLTAGMAAAGGTAVSRACFENPVEHDLLSGGRKIAGAAQRRTRAGLLHQGSVQGVDLPAGFGGVFAGKLGAEVRAREFEISDSAERLAAEKYGSTGWLEKRL